MLIIKQNIFSHFTHALSVRAAPGYKAMLIIITFLDITHCFKIQQNKSGWRLSNASVKCVVYVSVFSLFSLPLTIVLRLC